MKKSFLCFLTLALILSFTACGNSNLDNNQSSSNNSLQTVTDNSPGTVFESENGYIRFEYNKSQIHKCYIFKRYYDDHTLYYCKIDQNNCITFYSGAETLESQKVDSEEWQIYGGSFKGEKVGFQMLKSEFYDSMHKVDLTNLGRNPANDPDITIEEARKIAKEQFDERGFSNIEYDGISKEKIFDCYVFTAKKPGATHTRSAEAYIDVKTGEVRRYGECT